MSLDTIDYDINVFNAQSREADKGLAVRFYQEPIKDDVKSLQEGRPIFADTEMVEIRVRGDRNNIVQRPARDDDRRRFSDAYKFFKSGVDGAQQGTPLSEWPIMSRSMTEELKYFGFYTVEQLSNADDGACARMPGLTTMREKAKIYLEAAAGGSPIERVTKENQDLKDRMAAMERQLSELNAIATTAKAEAAGKAATAKVKD